MLLSLLSLIPSAALLIFRDALVAVDEHAKMGCFPSRKGDGMVVLVSRVWDFW